MWCVQKREKPTDLAVCELHVFEARLRIPTLPHVRGGCLGRSVWQVFWLASHTWGRLPGLIDQWHFDPSSSLTAAGPRRIFTPLPFSALAGTFERVLFSCDHFFQRKTSCRHMRAGVALRSPLRSQGLLPLMGRRGRPTTAHAFDDACGSRLTHTSSRCPCSP